jgi:hypothetical protein
MVSPPMQLNTLTNEREVAAQQARLEDLSSFDAYAQARDLKMWIHALRAFFNPRNHPFPETNQSDLVKHDWINELTIVRGTLLRASQLVFHLIHSENSGNTLFTETDEAFALDDGVAANVADEMEGELEDDSLYTAASLLSDACELCESLLNAPKVTLHAWTNLGETLAHTLNQIDNSKALSQFVAHRATLNIPAPLLEITQQNIKPVALGADMLHIFSIIFDLLDNLSKVEKFLRRDQSLKQTLPIFSLVHEKTNELINFIKTRALRIEGLEQNAFETLDSTNYAIRMELRKVFAHELVDMVSLRHAPAIYIKVENANGLLRDSFRQSAIGLAQLFNSAIEGSQLFDAFQTKLDQSLALRRDLWTLSQLVRRAEKEQTVSVTERLMKKLVTFHEGSLRYLMFKDWESCERFMEEVGAARGAAELAPVFHRFSAYLEALSSQVNMRAVLLNHPFDYPALEDD